MGLCCVKWSRCSKSAESIVLCQMITLLKASWVYCAVSNDHTAQSQLSLSCCVKWSRCSKPAESRFWRWAKWLYDVENDIIGSVYVYMWGQLIYQEFCVAFTTNMHVLFVQQNWSLCHSQEMHTVLPPSPSSTFLCMKHKTKKEGKEEERLATWLEI